MKKIFKALGTALLCAVLLSAFYLAVIMGTPQNEESAAITPRMDQPLLEALTSPVLIREEEQLSALLSYFPAQAMAAIHASGLVFEQGFCQDVPFDGGLGRSVTLHYRTAAGDAVTVASIYPARALALVEKGDYTLSGTAGLTLAGLRSVRMENESSIRMHAQGTEALYVVTLPRLSAADLRTVTSALQLYQGEQP